MILKLENNLYIVFVSFQMFFMYLPKWYATIHIFLKKSAVNFKGFKDLVFLQ